jgi:hypothetical protein
MGGFWFYVGAIAGFLAMRLALRLIGQRSKPGLAQKNTGVPVTVELKRSQHHGA